MGPSVRGRVAGPAPGCPGVTGRHASGRTPRPSPYSHTVDSTDLPAGSAAHSRCLPGSPSRFRISFSLHSKTLSPEAETGSQRSKRPSPCVRMGRSLRESPVTPLTLESEGLDGGSYSGLRSMASSQAPRPWFLEDPAVLPDGGGGLSICLSPRP